MYETFEKTYRGILPDDKLESFLKTVESNDYIEEIYWDYNMLVFEEDEKIVGYATFGCKEDTVLLYELYILPDQQKKGIGKQIVEELYLMNPDKIFLDVEVVTENRDAIQFYEKIGFDKIQSYEHGSGFGIDVYLMRKKMKNERNRRVES